MLNQRLASVYLAVDAAMSGDRDLVVEAMLADGAVSDPGDARTLAEDLIAAQAEHLPAFA